MASLKKAILEELGRQIGAAKNGKSTEVISASPKTPVSAIPVSGTEPPFTRSKSKRKPDVEETSESKRQKKVVSSTNANLPLAFKESLEAELVQLKTDILSRDDSISSPIGRQQCVIDGCINDALKNRIYCSDECISNHVRDSLKAMSESPVDLLTPPSTSSDESMWKDSAEYSLLISQPTPALASKLLAITQRRKSLSDGAKPLNLADITPVPVIEAKTGKVLSGTSAPTVANVEQWLKENGTYTIIKSDSLLAQSVLSIPTTPSTNTSSKVDLKTPPIPTSSTPASSFKSKMDSQSSKKSEELLSLKPRVTRKRSNEISKGEETPTKVAKSDHESTRSFSRNSLKDALWGRCKEANDLKTTEAIVEQVATEIEDSLFSLFKNDAGSKYKNKFRSLVYNIKDSKNPELFREIITKRIVPGKLLFSLVTMIRIFTKTILYIFR